MTSGVLLGGLAGLVGTGVHQVMLGVGGNRWPVGVLAALVLVAVVHGSVRAAWPGSWPSGLVTASWFVVVAVAAVAGPGGDLLVPGNGRGYAWLLGGSAVLVAGSLTGRPVAARAVRR